MTHRYIKMGVTGAVLIAAFVGLLWSTLRDGTEYFKNVDEVLPQRQAWEGKPMQLKGYVVIGSRMRKPNSLEWKFKIQNNPARASESGGVVDAYYTGVVPDTFKDESEVVLQGRLTPNGFDVKPNGVVAKCPSKYEPAGAAASAGS
jgi:cytochrome c-type biogenesis protein CcmE